METEITWSVCEERKEKIRLLENVKELLEKLSGFLPKKNQMITLQNWECEEPYLFILGSPIRVYIDENSCSCEPNYVAKTHTNTGDSIFYSYYYKNVFVVELIKEMIGWEMTKVMADFNSQEKSDKV